jgi:hypothetical protein
MYGLYCTGPAWYVPDGDDDGVYGGPGVHQQKEREEENKKQIYLPGTVKFTRRYGTYLLIKSVTILFGKKVEI